MVITLITIKLNKNRVKKIDIVLNFSKAVLPILIHIYRHTGANMAFKKNPLIGNSPTLRLSVNFESSCKMVPIDIETLEGEKKLGNTRPLIFPKLFSISNSTLIICVFHLRCNVFLGFISSTFSHPENYRSSNRFFSRNLY